VAVVLAVLAVTQVAAQVAQAAQQAPTTTQAQRLVTQAAVAEAVRHQVAQVELTQATVLPAERQRRLLRIVVAVAAAPLLQRQAAQAAQVK
jgi:hypothetical protein